jgi:hypothetical protein
MVTTGSGAVEVAIALDGGRPEEVLRGVAAAVVLVMRGAITPERVG